MVGVIKNQNKEYHGGKRGPGFKAFKSSMSRDRRVKKSLGCWILKPLRAVDLNKMKRKNTSS